MSLGELIGLGITLMISLIGAFWVLLSLVFKQFELRIAGKLSAIEKDAQAREERIESKLTSIENDAQEWMRLEKDFLRFQAELPERYVRREDYIRNQTVLETKMDSLALKIENWQLREVAKK